jgi:serine/threonine protein kinase
MSEPNQVFISYAHEDVRWREEFERMLAPAQERGLIGVWSDDAIEAGENWYQNIQRALTRARVGLLLVTDHFLQSKFIKREELARMLASARSGGVSIRWVPVSAALYQFTELNDIQGCWDPSQPLDKLPEADRKAAIQKICLEIVEEFGREPPKVSENRRGSLRAQVQGRLGDKYLITDEIASGKFSVVYQAQRQHPKRVVAVKTFVVSELDEWARRAFEEGVERAFELASPAFIKILDHYMEEPPEFVVSEFVVGQPLNRFLHGHPNGLPLATVKSILLDLSKAIEEAHARGWRRGELCPSDVLIEASGLARISVLDFSNLLREEAQLKGEYLIDRESLAFMTPERYLGRESTLLTDQYSLGLIATELLGGPRVPRVVRPCDLESKRQLFADLESGKGAWAERSPEFAGIVCRMLRVDPDERWPSITDVRDLLKEIEVSESSAERDRKLATSSYVRFQARGIEGERQFYSRFYRNLFAAVPEVERHFQAIDMERQYSMLNRAIHALLEFDPQSDKAKEQIVQMAARHAGFRLTRRHYDVFLDTLLKTIEECGESDPARLAAWHATLARGIEFLWQCDQKHQLTMPAVLQQPAAETAAPKPKDGQRRGKRPAAPASLG